MLNRPSHAHAIRHPGQGIGFGAAVSSRRRFGALCRAKSKPKLPPRPIPMFAAAAALRGGRALQRAIGLPPPRAAPTFRKHRRPIRSSPGLRLKAQQAYNRTPLLRLGSRNDGSLTGLMPFAVLILPKGAVGVSTGGSTHLPFIRLPAPIFLVLGGSAVDAFFSPFSLGTANRGHRTRTSGLVSSGNPHLNRFRIDRGRYCHGLCPLAGLRTPFLGAPDETRSSPGHQALAPPTSAVPIRSWALNVANANGSTNGK